MRKVLVSSRCIEIASRTELASPLSRYARIRGYSAAIQPLLRCIGAGGERVGKPKREVIIMNALLGDMDVYPEYPSPQG